MSNDETNFQDIKPLQLIDSIKTENCAYDPQKDKIPTHLLRHVSLAKRHTEPCPLPFPTARYSRFRNANGRHAIFVFDEGQCGVYDIVTNSVSC